MVQALHVALGSMDFFPKIFKYTVMDIDILEAGEYVPL